MLCANNSTLLPENILSAALHAPVLQIISNQLPAHDMYQRYNVLCMSTEANLQAETPCHQLCLSGCSRSCSPA